MIFFQLLGLLFFLVVLYILYPSYAQDEKAGGDVTDEKDYDRVLRNQKHPFSSRKKWRSKIPYAQLIREVVYFTGPVLSEKGIKKYPEIKICYYENKKWMGVFTSFNNEVRVYLKSHQNIPSLVDTVLHEVAHYIQNTSGKKEFKYYGHYNDVYGYEKNPLEVDSRRFAKKWTNDCLRYLAEKRWIIYQ
jgi:hypothetical protein